MSTLMPFLALDQTCEQVQAWVNGQLTGAGFRVVQTFDLQAARLAHPDCPCPHHGTEACNCQMVVLLIYWKHESPATLVLHGQDGRTWLSLANPATRGPGHKLGAAIRRALIPRPIDLPTPIEMPHEVRPTG